MSFLAFCVFYLEHKRVKPNALFMQGRLVPLSQVPNPSSWPFMAEKAVLTELGPIRLRREYPLSRFLLLFHTPWWWKKDLPREQRDQMFPGSGRQR